MLKLYLQAGCFGNPRTVSAITLEQSMIDGGAGQGHAEILELR
jgi:hypothetical protein